MICCPKQTNNRFQTCQNQIEAVSVQQFRWMVLLRYEDTNKKKSFYDCIGSLISSTMLLTSAHCITGLDIGVKLTGIRMGMRDLGVDCPFNSSESTEKCSGIQDFLINYAWYPNEGEIVFTRSTGSTFKHDIGLIMIKDAVQYSKKVIPVCLLNIPIKVDDPKMIIVAWKGDLNDVTGQIDTVLHQKSVKSVSLMACNDAFNATLNEDRQLCIEEHDQECGNLGKSGSVLHLVHNGKISAHAISSYGQDRCQEANKLRVFTLIQPYIELMQEKSMEFGMDDFPMTVLEIF